MTLVRMSTFVLDDRGQLRLIQESHRARADDDAWTNTGQAIGDGGGMIERQCPRTALRRSGQQIEEAAVARSGQDRAQNDDPDHAEEHDADVRRQRQTESVGQSESLEGMPAENPLPEFTDAAHEPGSESARWRRTVPPRSSPAWR